MKAFIALLVVGILLINVTRANVNGDGELVCHRAYQCDMFRSFYHVWWPFIRGSGLYCMQNCCILEEWLGGCHECPNSRGCTRRDCDDNDITLAKK